MSEVESFFNHLKSYPDEAPCSLSLGFGTPQPQLGFSVASQQDPAVKVKEHLFNIICYCSLAFAIPVDLKAMKDEIFSNL